MAVASTPQWRLSWMGEPCPRNSSELTLASPFRTTAIVFSFEEASALRRLLSDLLATSVDQILVMHGGNDGTRELVAACRDPRVESVFEEERTGKWDALNRGIVRATGDVVFLLSGDIRLPPGTFDQLLSRIGPGVGVAFPQVRPTNVRGLVARLGAKLWDLRAAQFEIGHALGLSMHGGEAQAIRRSLLEPVPPVINEDALLCLRVVGKGYRAVYASEVLVENTVPETLRELLSQRTRINVGHWQLAEQGYLPVTLDTLMIHHPRLFVRMLGRAILTSRRDLVLLPLLAIVEWLSLFRGYLDYRSRRDYSRWPLVRSGKGSVD